MYSQSIFHENRASHYTLEHSDSYPHTIKRCMNQKAAISTETQNNTCPTIRFSNSAPIQMVNGDGYLKYKYAYKSDSDYMELRELYRQYLQEPSLARKESCRKNLIRKCNEYLEQDDIKNNGRHKGRTRMVNDLLVKLGPVPKEYSDGHAVFEFGEDIVFGLDINRKDVINNLLHGNHFAFEFGMRQNDLTNAIWSASTPTKIFSETEISADILKNHPELNHNPQYVQSMVTRIMGFQEFIQSKYARTKKEGYNIYKPNNGNMNSAIDTWKHTSKAGLEYQLCIRKRDVCLAVDGLVIKDVIKGDPDSKQDRVRSITSGEVRWLFRHKDDPDVREHLKLFKLSSGELIPLDDFFGQPEWSAYANYRAARAAERQQASSQ